MIFINSDIKTHFRLNIKSIGSWICPHAAKKDQKWSTQNFIIYFSYAILYAISYLSYAISVFAFVISYISYAISYEK